MTNLPGFIDLQVNGFLKIDFSANDLTEEKVIYVIEQLTARGTAGFLATVITSAPETYERNLPIIGKVAKMPEFSGKLLGIHLEGPFLSPEPGAVGAHNPAYVQKPDINFLNKMIEWSQKTVRVITIAAEREGAADFTRYAVSKGITVSLGHQMALGDKLAELANAGAKLITHLGNGMPNMIPRHKNTVWDALAEDKLTPMIITDGHHLPAPVVKVMLKTKGVHNLIVTSDASPLAGCPPGRYETLGNLAILEESGLLHNPEKGCLVGSSATAFECANFLASTFDFLTPEDIAQMAFYNPLKMIGIAPELIKSKNSVSYDKKKKAFVLIKG